MEEIEGDLFIEFENQPESCAYAHCISANLALSAGIAVDFRNRYKNRFDELRDQHPTVGNIVIWKKLSDSVLPLVYNLVTKPIHYDKPTLESLEKSLIAMRDHACNNGITEIRMPTIGCGLDKLKWKDVKEKLKQIFNNTGIVIKVFIYKPKKVKRLNNKKILNQNN